MNTVRLRNGRVFSLMYDTKPIADKPGYRSTTRWESDDEWKTLRGPLTDGDVYLPPDEFNAANIQWFHGNTIEMPDGVLLAAMQGIDKEGSGIYPFHTFVSRSEDGGKTWTFLARVASLGNIDDPDGLTKKGWRLHGPCEHSLVHLGDGRFDQRRAAGERRPRPGAGQGVRHLPRFVVCRAGQRDSSRHGFRRISFSRRARGAPRWSSPIRPTPAALGPGPSPWRRRAAASRGWP